MRRLRRSLIGRWAVVLALLAKGWTGVASQVPAPAAPTVHQEFHLELRISNRRVAFHRGEVIPIELIFSSGTHEKLRIGEDCGGPSTYQFHVTPSGFVDRASEHDAAGRVYGMDCHGWAGVENDLAAKPLKVDMLLNDRFRMGTSGHYKVFVTTQRIGVPLTSNPLEVEILPFDREWEQRELARAETLMAADAQSRGEGCKTLSYLETKDAELGMAHEYQGDGYCDHLFYAALINARNRREVLEELEAGLARADHPIRQQYLHTLAKISLYQQHPDWYPVPLPENTPPRTVEESMFPMRSGLWHASGAVAQEELRYVEILAQDVSQKTGEARAVSLKTLLELDRNSLGAAVPEKLNQMAREQLPHFFLSLTEPDQRTVLEREWSGADAPQAMVPVLKQIVGHDAGGPRDLALLRLMQLSPTDARTVVMDLLRSDARFSVSTLSRLPDPELPELDNTFLQNFRSKFPDEYRLDDEAGLIGRYASPAIARQIRDLVEGKLFKLDGRTQSYLVGYFLRVNPPLGQEMLRKEIVAPDRNEFDLTTLAEVTNPHDTETAALIALQSPNPIVLRDALTLLQAFGTSKSRFIVLRRFRLWSAHWKLHPALLDLPDNAFAVSQQNDFVNVLAMPALWFATPGEIQGLSPLCLTEDCREYVSQLGATARQTHPDIEYLGWSYGPMAGDGFVVGQYQNLAGLDQLRGKLLQYPKGYVFQLHSSFGAYRRTQEIYETLLPFARKHGIEIRLQQE